VLGPLSQPWTQSGGTWTQSGGVLYQTSSVPGDKKALLTDQSYPANTQITAKVRVDDWNDTNNGDTVGGVGVLTDPSTGSGYNLVFSSADRVSFLDDQVALGNSYSFDWNPGTWYWFQLADIQGTLYGKIWQDGSTEPSGWMFQQSGWTDRTAGAPSLNGGSGNATVSISDVSIDATFTPTIAATQPTGVASSPWGIVGGVWTQASGVISQTSVATGDKKAILTDNSYPTGSQITAKVQVGTWNSSSDVARAGVGILTDPTTGHGYNLLFRGSNTVTFLDDQVAWGNTYSFDWNPGTSYWFTLVDIQGTLYGKIWQDGSTEPSGWMFEQSGWTDRTAGAPSLNGGSGDATVSFSDVSIDPTASTGPPVVAFASLSTSILAPSWMLSRSDRFDRDALTGQVSMTGHDRKPAQINQSLTVNSFHLDQQIPRGPRNNGFRSLLRGY
jgi:hypothetical protein